MRYLLPTPVDVVEGAGSLSLSGGLRLQGGGRASRVLVDRLQRSAGIGVSAGHDTTPVRFRIDDSLSAEGYLLRIDEDGVLIVSASEHGAHHAVQTILQLLPPWIHGPGPVDPATLRLPHVTIRDEPLHPWRGSMIDVARHFLPLGGLLRHLDIMAMHKLNVLHLHLTDDQGWRIPIRKYPLLTAVGGRRPGTLSGRQPAPDENDCDDVAGHDGIAHHGSYTAEEIATLLRHADALGITVVPEIDMPGHMEAAIAAYPWLGACDHVRHPRTCWGISQHVLRLSDETLGFCRDVLDEVMDLFPGSPIHIGGDECPGDEWLADPVSSATMRGLGATDAAQAQAWFEKQICAHVQSRGRQVIAWDEVLEGGAPPGVTVMAWRGAQATHCALSRGHDVIATPVEHTYLDHAQYTGGEAPLTYPGLVTQSAVAELHHVLSSPSPDASGRILGGQMQLWGEYVRDWARAEYQQWPRGCSIAEQLWSGSPGTTATPNLLHDHLERLTAAGINWCRHDMTGNRR